MGQIHPTAVGPRTVRKKWDNPEPSSMDNYDSNHREAETSYAVTVHASKESLLHNARLEVLKEAVTECYRMYSVNHSITCRNIYVEYLKYLQPVSNIRIHSLDSELAAEAADSSPAEVTAE